MEPRARGPRSRKREGESQIGTIREESRGGVHNGPLLPMSCSRSDRLGFQKPVEATACRCPLSMATRSGQAMGETPAEDAPATHSASSLSTSKLMLPESGSDHGPLLVTLHWAHILLNLEL